MRLTTTTQAVHADGSVCTHPTAPTGQPRDPATSPGRRGYVAACSGSPDCTWTGERRGMRTLADDDRKAHRDHHAQAPAPATA